MTTMIDLNEFYARYCADQEGTKFEMVQAAARELFKAVQENYYDFEDLKYLNYVEICEWCGWPNFQDCGIFEQAIDLAANMVLGVMGYKPQH